MGLGGALGPLGSAGHEAASAPRPASSHRRLCLGGFLQTPGRPPSLLSEPMQPCPPCEVLSARCLHFHHRPQHSQPRRAPSSCSGSACRMGGLRNRWPQARRARGRPAHSCTLGREAAPHTALLSLRAGLGEEFLCAQAVPRLPWARSHLFCDGPGGERFGFSFCRGTAEQREARAQDPGSLHVACAWCALHHGPALLQSSSFTTCSLSTRCVPGAVLSTGDVCKAKETQTQPCGVCDSPVWTRTLAKITHLQM